LERGQFLGEKVISEHIDTASPEPSLEKFVPDTVCAVYIMYQQQFLTKTPSQIRNI